MPGFVDRMCGRMKIYERYSLAEKIFAGKGIWGFFLPARFILSLLFKGWLSLTGGKDVRRNCYSEAEERSNVNKIDSPRVISIGNLVVGGGGKTPCVIALAKEIINKGGRPVIITRGYGSAAEKARKPVLIESENRDKDIRYDYLTVVDYTGGVDKRISDRLFAETFGDEVAIFREEGIPVVVDAKRGRGARLAAEILNPTDILLDDAFQNNSLRKDIDILLLDYKAPFAGGKVLPLGALREKPEAVKRADVIIFTRSEGERVPGEVSRFTTGKRIYFSRHEFSAIYGRRGETIDMDELKGRKIALYSGIAYPVSFEGMVARDICIPIASFRYSDHHRYTAVSIESMVTAAGKDVIFLTTEKDWFKTHELFPTEVEVYAVKIKMEIKGINGLTKKI